MYGRADKKIRSLTQGISWFDDEDLRRYIMFDLRLLNKKHLNLTICHLSYKIHKQLFYFRVQIYFSKVTTSHSLSNLILRANPEPTSSGAMLYFMVALTSSTVAVNSPSIWGWSIEVKRTVGNMTSLRQKLSSVGRKRRAQTGSPTPCRGYLLLAAIHRSVQAGLAIEFAVSMGRMHPQFSVWTR